MLIRPLAVLEESTGQAGQARIREEVVIELEATGKAALRPQLRETVKALVEDHRVYLMESRSDLEAQRACNPAVSCAWTRREKVD